jgi:hypothetical protein
MLLPDLTPSQIQQHMILISGERKHSIDSQKNDQSRISGHSDQCWQLLDFKDTVTQKT